MENKESYSKEDVLQIADAYGYSLKMLTDFYEFARGLSVSELDEARKSESKSKLRALALDAKSSIDLFKRIVPSSLQEPLIRGIKFGVTSPIGALESELSGFL